MVQFLTEKIRLLCDSLRTQSKTVISVVSMEKTDAVDYKKGNTPPEDGWQPYNGEQFSGRDSHYWFRASFRTPAADENLSYYLNFATGFEGQWDGTNPQGLLYLNGEMVQGIDTNHTEAYLEPDTEYQMVVYFYNGLIDANVTFNAKMVSVDNRLEQLFYDISVPLDCCATMNTNSDEYIKIMCVLEQTANLIDQRILRSNAYYESVEKASRFIKSELYEKLCSTEGKPVVNCVAHTHIDVEWYWTRQQTREKIQRSFATLASLMKRYPEYRFMLSQPELYRYLKEEAPEKYDELKSLVKEGRFEPEGAMWLEADTNLSSGESLVRQLIYGKRFFKEEFGIESHVLFLPDVFGYSGALPQILRKSGVDRFVTSKISWNETNMFPYDAFMWQGIDGTEIFAEFITTQNYFPNPIRHTVYTGVMTPSEIKGNRNRFLQKEYSDETLCTFGHGDGGGGPTRAMLERQRRLALGIPGMPVTKIDFLVPHLDRVKESFDNACERTKRTPRWVGEMYLEFHRGTYTSIAKNKRNNRFSEQALQQLEAVSVTDMLFGGDYDTQGLEKAWKKVLHNQFHDILPGSSNAEIYDLTDADYAEVLDYCAKNSNKHLSAIAQKVKTDGGVLVYNSLGFPVKGTVNVNGKTVELEREVPALGWCVVTSEDSSCAVSVCGLTAENKYYKLTLNTDGSIAELYDKRAERSVFSAGQSGNLLEIFEDIPRKYENWEITGYYQQKCWVLDDAAEITPITDGSRAGFKIVKHYLSSVISQNLWLYSENERIDFETEIDWHEHQQLLKAAFPLDIHSNSLTCDIQFGHIERPTHRNTSWDAAKFEVCAHKWVDLSENGYGVAMLNDCKYGYSAEGNVLKLTMLKCGIYPNKQADQGKHRFTYSLLPHIGDFRESGVITQAALLNRPLEAMEIKPNQNGMLPSSFSLINCDNENIVIETVKKAENDGSVIVRLYDAFDRKTKAKINVCDGFKAVYLCDLMENPIKELEFNGSSVTLPVSNFEIITLKFMR